MPKSDKTKVLIIDDDPDVVNALKLILEREKFTVLSAEDGLQGVKLAKSELPDTIILDVLMPKQDGLTTFSDLASIPEMMDTQIIMLTSVNDKLGFGVSLDEMETLYGRQPDAYFDKPVEPKELIEAIRAWRR